MAPSFGEPMLRSIVFIAVVALCLLPLRVALAGAEVLFVETWGMDTRGDAQEMNAAAQAGGLRSRVVRRFRRGQGWEYVVRIDDADDRESARRQALALANATGVHTAVYVRAGRNVLPITEVAPGDDVAGGVEPPEADPRDEAEGHDTGLDLETAQGDPFKGQELLAAAVRSHGGGMDTPAALASLPCVHFRFERILKYDDDMLRVWHDYWRDGEQERLEIRILEGQGKDSVAVVKAGEGAWVQVDGETREADEGLLGEALRVFPPERVLERALSLGMLDADSEAILVGSQEEGGMLLDIILVPGANGSPSIYLGIDDADHRIRQVRIDDEAGELLWVFGDYHELKNHLVVPYTVDLWLDGQQREVLSVKILTFPENASQDLFEL